MKLSETYVELRPSKNLVGQIGLFSTQKIKKGQVVFLTKKFNEEFVKWNVYKETSNINKKKIMSFCLGSENGFWLPSDFNYLPISYFMNNSCDPNIGFDKIGNFIAINNIKKDEELVWDYGFAETNPNFKMNCLCNSKKCRKKITGKDYYDNNLFSEEQRIFKFPIKLIQ